MVLESNCFPDFKFRFLQTLQKETRTPLKILLTAASPVIRADFNMHSTSVFALVILAIFTLCLASPTPAGTNKVPDRETAGQIARRFEPHAFDQNTASPNPSAMVKRTMQLDCTRNHLCDSVITENMCLTAFDQIVDDTTYRTGVG